MSLCVNVFEKVLFFNNILNFWFYLWQEISTVVIKYTLSFHQALCYHKKMHQKPVQFCEVTTCTMLPAKLLSDRPARQQVNCLNFWTQRQGFLFVILKNGPFMTPMRPKSRVFLSLLWCWLYLTVFVPLWHQSVNSDCRGLCYCLGQGWVTAQMVKLDLWPQLYDIL